ncbi:MAG: hypothetical protein JNG90_11855 [Planctomycetaceae bacterium]|nr:hypothetical protein [Planctomycetaceae bacterium]
MTYWNPMSNESEFLPLLDGCRADSAGRPEPADLAAAAAADPALRPLVEKLAHDPAAQELFARVRRIDQRIQAALHDAPVPAGLAERILAGIAAPVDEQPSGISAAIAAAAPAADAAAVQRRLLSQALWQRRYWLAAAGATAAGLALTIHWFTSATVYSPERLLEATRQFESTAPREPGTFLSVAAPPASYAISQRIVTSIDARWRPVPNFLGRRGVAYDLRTPNGVTATLYVARLGGLTQGPQIDTSRLPTAPPSRPQPASGGASMAAWQEHGRLYVLVVHGDQNAYRQLIRPAPAIAWLPCDPQGKRLEVASLPLGTCAAGSHF